MAESSYRRLTRMLADIAEDLQRQFPAASVGDVVVCIERGRRECRHALPNVTT
jgi:hypothetical protein